VTLSLDAEAPKNRQPIAEKGLKVRAATRRADIGTAQKSTLARVPLRGPQPACPLGPHRLHAFDHPLPTSPPSKEPIFFPKLQI